MAQKKDDKDGKGGNGGTLTVKEASQERAACLPVRQHHADFPFKSRPDSCSAWLIIEAQGR